MDEKLEKEIESVLFWKAEPVEISELAKILKVKESAVRQATVNVRQKLSGHGISLIDNGDKLSLVTSSETAELIDQLQKEELTKDLSKAALETLSIVLYRGPIKRSGIDYIRGVNSQFTLRNLLIRGLIEKKTDKNDERSYVYTVTNEALAFLGVENVTGLPDYEKVNSDIASFENSNKKDDVQDN